MRDLDLGKAYATNLCALTCILAYKLSGAPGIWTSLLTHIPLLGGSLNFCATRSRAGVHVCLFHDIKEAS